MHYALVTGGSQGLGMAICERLLSEGFNVALCARNIDKLRAAATEWKRKYPKAEVLAIVADLANVDGADIVSDVVLERFPHLDILVNNTGSYEPGMIIDEADGTLERMLQVNLMSAYRLTRKLVPAMIARRKGHIVNMCSVASLKAYPNGGSYSISKYALLGFSDNLREELRPHGVKVTSLCPGATWSPSWEGSGVAPERIMQAQDVAEMVWASHKLSGQAVAETIIMRPLLGDL